MQVHSQAAPTILQWSPDKKHSERERWVCIYPAYINNKKSIAQGRRIAKEKCVENPTHQEIRDVLVDAGFKVGVENKLYSRERSKELLYRGRIRVQLKNDDGSLFNPKFSSRESIMLYLGEKIPKLKSRVSKPSGEQTAQTSQGKGKGKGKGKK
ncbi:signal recognition particle 19 kDa protein [Cylas formicarius]|uniref:signal recognition particle 19 kDa protein n=1 Tax=Cylas formicarius TaxID=197179 RepID=UPI002958C7A8|nr:signal recognition particle 19 kDa protein [Cylas formicarius]